MGARHLVVVDGELGAVGIITRADMNEHRLAHFWHEEVTIMWKYWAAYAHNATSSSLPSPTHHLYACLDQYRGSRCRRT